MTSQPQYICSACRTPVSDLLAFQCPTCGADLTAFGATRVAPAGNASLASTVTSEEPDPSPDEAGPDWSDPDFSPKDPLLRSFGFPSWWRSVRWLGLLAQYGRVGFLDFGRLARRFIVLVALGGGLLAGVGVLTGSNTGEGWGLIVVLAVVVRLISRGYYASAGMP